MATNRDLLQVGDHLDQAVMDGRPKDLLLVLEVVVNRGPVYSGFLGDSPHRRGTDSLALQDRHGSTQNRLPLRAILRAIFVLGSAPFHRQCWRLPPSPCHTAPPVDLSKNDTESLLSHTT